MMGRQTTEQTRLFYEFRLEDRMPEGHLLRRIDGLTSAAPQKKALAGTRAGVSHMSDTGRHGYGVMVNQPLMLRKKSPAAYMAKFSGALPKMGKTQVYLRTLEIRLLPDRPKKAMAPTGALGWPRTLQYEWLIERSREARNRN